jgi:S-adenosylmethionine:tRNA ribosyltransferase-isomerase
MGVNLIQALKEKTPSTISTDDISVKQWDPYESPQGISASEALRALLSWMNENKLDKLIAKTQIIITPPYKLKIVTALITNFHQPKSTLLLLVAAVIGDDWKNVYDYALKNNFRFLSYGDGCLFFPRV